MTTDPFVRNDPDLIPLEEVLERSDLLVLCVPHTTYRHLDLRDQPVVDLWGFYGGPIIPQPKPLLLRSDTTVSGTATARERRSAS